ncbi:hypothetical protein [Capnocytophaga felis]|uniref:Uncharacterized protein n=1 Tax=Capnocytophaga felis TaxID=2267611 RepID=A0A5M4BC56_9FLAO|nr:hypothetical protein [Capnocytophaga felis]GET46666.1 hypothetical protein RCZ01_19680 [Capnocytophaga felis]GET48768.1 hypothetical protein RCZ02_15990 [Capnocytophaga felis]
MKQITLLSENHTDYHLGFEVQSPEPKFFSWDATYEEVIASPWVKQIFYKDYGEGQLSRQFAFKFPVRVGNLLFYNFEFGFTSRQRTDIAVREYRFTSKKGASKHDFLQICEQFNKDLSHREVDEYLENSYYNNHTDDISFRMQYYGEARHRDFFLSIYNTRNYHQIVKPLENAIQLTDFLVFPPKDIRMDANYREDIRVKRRPSLLTEKFGNQSILWRDEENQQIGVSVDKFVRVFPLSDIEKVYIERMLPAKGHGADYIFIRYKNEKYPTKILEAENNFFDKVDLEKIFKQKILFGGEYYNC